MFTSATALLIAAVCSLSLFFSTASLAQAYPGLPTRDQTPLLQAYFIPAAPFTPHQGWAFSNSLYVTNTYQFDHSGDENLLIDVENTRFDFQASYVQQDWLLNINIPVIRNNPGFLDQTIVGWHDFFGLPQGGRDQATNNRLQLLVENADGIVIDSTQNDSGIGDIQLAAGYQLSPRQQLWLGIELAVSDNPVISNQSTDYALWYAHSGMAHGNLTPYGLIGLSFPADSGVFKGQLEKQFVFGQLGFIYAWREPYQFFLQSDFHSSLIRKTRLDALGTSLQAQFGVRLPRLFKSLQLELFFSEDIAPGHAPDITFGLRLSPLPEVD